jgi:hypothetical protein
MSESDDPRPRVGWFGVVLFVASAAAFAGLLRMTWERPFVGLLAFASLGSFVAWRWWVRTRLVRMLRRGDFGGVVLHWTERLERAPHAETLTPLMSATAFTAYGRIEEARRALASARRGPAWEAALEHRLFLETLLSTFEGDRGEADRALSRLESMPIQGDRALRARIAALRIATGALVRAFTHAPLPGDRMILEAAAEQSPLVFWAMRYAAAIVAIDEGDRPAACALIEGAPRWPEESAFGPFHREIEQVAMSQGEAEDGRPRPTGEGS